jgi:hypothetical protein
MTEPMNMLMSRRMRLATRERCDAGIPTLKRMPRLRLTAAATSVTRLSRGVVPGRARTRFVLRPPFVS